MENPLCSGTLGLFIRSVGREEDEHSRLPVVSSLLCNLSHVGLRLSQDVKGSITTDTPKGSCSRLMFKL